MPIKTLTATLAAAVGVAALTAGIAPTAHANQPTLTIASYNILKINANEPGVPSWQQRLPRLTNIINDLNADILSLQEVTNHPDPTSGRTQADQVRTTLTNTGYETINPADNQCVRPRDAAGQLAGPNPCDTTTLLAWKAGKITVATDANGLPMTGTYLAGNIAPTNNPAANARSVQWAFLNDGTQTFLVVGVHTSSGQNPATEAGRVAFAEALTPWTNQLTETRGLTGIPMFIAGDLNSYKQRQPRGAQQILENNGWSDAYNTATTRVGERYATINVTPQTRRFNGFPPKPFRYSKKREPSRIDYIFSKNATPVYYETVVRLNRNGTFNEQLRISDHNAVIAKYAL